MRSARQRIGLIWRTTAESRCLFRNALWRESYTQNYAVVLRKFAVILYLFYSCCHYNSSRQPLIAQNRFTRIDYRNKPRANIEKCVVVVVLVQCFAAYRVPFTGGVKKVIRTGPTMEPCIDRSYRATFFPNFPLLLSKKNRKNRKRFQKLEIQQWAKYLKGFAFQCFIKSWKTSSVSTTVWMVETQLCKLRGTSDTFV